MDGTRVYNASSMRDKVLYENEPLKVLLSLLYFKLALQTSLL